MRNHNKAYKFIIVCIFLCFDLVFVVCFLQSANESAMDMDEAVRLIQVPHDNDLLSCYWQL